jgi:hypothetical protein
MIPNHLIWSNFIIFRLNIQQIPAQHISGLGYTLLPLLWALPDS